MKNKDAVVGRVEENLSAGLFRVKLADDREVICYVAGKLRKNKINIFVGDRVEVILDPAGGKATNRIVWRK